MACLALCRLCGKLACWTALVIIASATLDLPVNSDPGIQVLQPAVFQLEVPNPNVRLTQTITHECLHVSDKNFLEHWQLQRLLLESSFLEQLEMSSPWIHSGCQWQVLQTVTGHHIYAA